MPEALLEGCAGASPATVPLGTIGETVYKPELQLSNTEGGSQCPTSLYDLVHITLSVQSVSASVHWVIITVLPHRVIEKVGWDDVTCIAQRRAR